ncbi:MAG: hypothetical protein J6M27_14280 [Lachnospiraceae bacterium]|nr:hypothetical protein [Lachnospiraceae bacterium]
MHLWVTAMDTEEASGTSGRRMCRLIPIRCTGCGVMEGMTGYESIIYQSLR